MKKYMGVSYELAEEGYWRIWFVDGAWNKMWGTEQEVRAYIRYVLKDRC